VAIDACVEQLSSAISKALAESTLKRCQRDDSQIPIVTRIHDEIHLKESVANR